MKVLARIFEWFKGLFRRSTGYAAIPSSKSVQYTTSAPEPKDEVDPITRTYGKYRRWMKKHGMMPGSRMNFVKGKHPLHSMHFGTWSPVKPIRGKRILHRSHAHGTT